MDEEEEEEEETTGGGGGRANWVADEMEGRRGPHVGTPLARPRQN